METKIKGTYEKDGSLRRICGFCKKHKELNANNFHRDNSRPLGFMYECKECSSMRIDMRKNRYRRMPQEQKDKLKIKDRAYRKTEIGRASALSYAYRKIDKAKGIDSKITKEYLVENIFSKPCFYCDDTNEGIGCDRIDNSKGHTIDNVVPCCRTCNTARMHNFTHQEMKIIGMAIGEVKRKRNSI